MDSKKIKKPERQDIGYYRA